MHRQRDPRAEVAGDLLGVVEIGYGAGWGGGAGALGSEAGERSGSVPPE
jgi:hypothetical protein